MGNLQRKKYGSSKVHVSEYRAYQNYPRTKGVNGIVLSTGEVVDGDYISDRDYKEALRIGIEAMLENNDLLLSKIIWKD